MLLVKWDDLYECLLDEESACSLVAILSRQRGDGHIKIYIIPTGLRLDPTTMTPLTNIYFHKGMFIKGGWQELARLEKETEGG